LPFSRLPSLVVKEPCRHLIVPDEIQGGCKWHASGGRKWLQNQSGAASSGVAGSYDRKIFLSDLRAALWSAVLAVADCHFLHTNASC
jgi:hypothetical protein